MNTRNWLGKWFPHREPEKSRPDLLVERLESRVLYSATPAMMAGGAFDSLEPETVDVQFDLDYSPATTASDWEGVETAVNAESDPGSFTLYDFPEDGANDRFVMSSGAEGSVRFSTLQDSPEVQVREIFMSLAY